jgi:hypothetical protein
MPVVTAAYTNFPSYRRSFETTACHAVSVVILGTVIAWCSATSLAPLGHVGIEHVNHNTEALR